MKKSKKVSKFDEVLGISTVGGLACLLGGSVLVTPFYGFLPLVCVLGGLFATVHVINIIESPEEWQKRRIHEAREKRDEE